MNSQDTSPLFVNSLAKGLAVLKAFEPSRSSMNLPEIAAATGITRSAAQRFAYTFEALGLLAKDPVSKRYSLTAHALEIGCHFLDSHSLLTRANPYLLSLCRETGETVNFAEPAKLDMVIIGRFPNPNRMMAHIPIGRHLPMFCSASGRMYLSSLPSEEALTILQHSQLKKYTQNTLTDIDAIVDEIKATKSRNYAICISEYFRDDLALAVPVYDGKETIAACLQISVSAARWTVEEAVERLIPLMHETAQLISTTPPSDSANAPFANKPL